MSNVVKTSLIVCIFLLTLVVGYYLIFYIPQKQKTYSDILKLELEAKIEKESTERARIELEKQQNLVVEKREEEESILQKQNDNTAALSSCLDEAEAKYKTKYAEVGRINEKYGWPEGSQDSIKILQDRRSQDRNECYQRYPASAI
jgi:hypothetical protein